MQHEDQRAELDFSLKGLNVKCSASERFLSEDLTKLLEDILSLNLPDIPQDVVVAGYEYSTGKASGESQKPEGSKLSTTDFAARLGSRSGSDLVMAAAAHLHLTRGMEEFRRAEILTEMKGARAFYRASYGGNLSKSLDMLTKSGRLLNPGSDTYTLAYQEVEKIKNYT